MDRLKELTQLLDLSTISSDDKSGLREYKLDQGTAFAIALKHNNDVAVVQSFMSAGSIFPYHEHVKSNEILVVYSGTVIVVTDEDRFELSPGDSIAICAGCGHMLHAITDVKIIAITIPPDAVAMPKKADNG